ncbi:MAG: sialidase family protein [Thermoplasmatota archaeon]
MHPSTPLVALVSMFVLAGCVGPLTGTGSGGTAGVQGTGAATFTAVRVVPGGWEPAIAVGPGDVQWVSTQGPSTRGAGGPAVVYSSSDGGLNWTRTPDPPIAQAGADNEIKVTPSGRILNSMLGSTGQAGQSGIIVQYSDDGGKTWKNSQGASGPDQDRPWLAVGSKDPSTGQYLVYLLWHNLGSGTADHEMFVDTSHDGGATFGTPVLITQPGSQAWSDLQCADSGGPSVIFTNPSTGQVYAVWGTRSSAAGGCGASVTGSFEINVVAATRVWVATSKDGGQTWTDSLAVDANSAGRMVGLQLQEGMVDTGGNVDLVYLETPKAYPNYEDAAVDYTWAPADLSHWAQGVTLVPGGDGTKAGAGAILPQMAVGDPGHVAAFYLAGNGNGSNALWYPMLAETFDGMDASPAVTVTQLSEVPAWQGTASALMGVCQPAGAPAPASSALAGFTCPRSSDVYGQALTMDCKPAFVWYAGIPTAKSENGTWVAEQTSGRTLCGPS